MCNARPPARWAAGLALALACALSAPPVAGAEGVRSLTVGAGYASGAAWQWLFGRNWRSVWTTPAELAVFDLAAVGAGLRAVRTVGGHQTRGLVLEGADGRSYTFRSLAKGHFVPAWLDWRPASDLLNDQASANFPAADHVVSVLARRVGVPATRSRLGVLPDDARLGEFRAEFAGRAGTLSEYPLPAGDGRPGTFGAVEIVGSDALWERARAGADAAVDARAYLRARLLDWWVGDFDRHPEQWRWMRAAEGAWQPLSEDHDHAFSRYEGAVSALVRVRNPWLLRFDDDYPVAGLVNNSRALDAWLLAGLELEAWQAEVAEFVRRAEAGAVDAALAALPAAWRSLARDEMRAVLRRRLAGLPAFALQVYAALAERVPIHGSLGDDVAEFACRADGALQLTYRRGAAPRPLRRRFSSRETRRIEVFGYGGRDRAVRTTPYTCGIEVVRHEGREVRVVRGVPSPAEVRPNSGPKLLRHRTRRGQVAALY